MPEKNERWDSLVSPVIICYEEKQEKPSWFSSLNEMVQLDTILFRRTFEEPLWLVQSTWIGKKSHYKSRVSLHEVPAKTR